MLENFDIVEATESQSDEIANLVNSAYRGESGRQGWTTEADLLDGQRTDPESIQAIINSENQRILVAEDAEEDQGLPLIA